MKQYLLLLFVFLVSHLSVFSQGTSRMWKDLDETEVPSRSERLIVPVAERILRLDVDAFEMEAEGVPNETEVNWKEWQLPMPDGSFQRFQVAETPLMAPELAAKFPQIKTYTGKGIDDPRATLRMDITPQGMHAMIISPKGSTFIDPMMKNDREHYTSYFKKDFRRLKEELVSYCELPALEKDPGNYSNPTIESTGDQLKTYRLAVATTGEYTAFHGGTVPLALAAVTTTINRVVGVYERELAIRMQLIPNNNLLIYTNASSDPYSNNSGGAMLGENQANINFVIGAANYDIGHVFSTGGGGIAGLGVVCFNSSKAEGVTGLPNPVGDPFAIDFVAHEIGHQFGANHTFNGTAGSCGGGNRESTTAYEPGSGSTIMAYAGICGSHNIQNSSDDYFHGISYDEIIDYTTNGMGASCPVVTNTNNQIPVVNVPPGGFTIPVGTPFELEANGSDPDGDSLTYCWEQFDLGPGGHPNTPTGNAPLFRSLSPDTNPVRVFPRLNFLVNNQASLGEVLPTTSRPLTFRATVRDNRPGGGGVNFDEVFFQSTHQAGPFAVTEPNTPVIWQAGSIHEIKWDVAQTDQAPVNTQLVNIFLSTDGGFTYPVTLATNVPNNGLAAIQIPANISGNTCRIKVKAADNIYFDISNQNFSIQAPANPGFSLYSGKLKGTFCIPDSFETEVVLTSFLGFSDQVNLSIPNLPMGFTAVFSPSAPSGSDTVSLKILTDGSATAGSVNLRIMGIAAGGEKDSLDLALSTFDEVPQQTGIALPALGAINQNTLPTFVWAPLNGATYDLEVSFTPGFVPDTIVISETGLTGNTFTPSTPLTPKTVYYWRVRAVNECGPGAFSLLGAFQTSGQLCQIFASTNVPVTIPEFNAPNTVSSFILIPSSTVIADLNVIDLQITHTWINDLDVTLNGPGGISVDLFTGICNDEDENFDLILDDEGTPGALPCPPVGGGAYQPEDSLSAFDGITANGIWTLSITDNENFDGGTLDSWALQICESDEGGAPPILLTNNTLSLLQWKHELITPQFLEAIDSVSGPNDLTFTLISPPVNGFVQLDSVNLPVGGIFTQADINNGKVRYQHNGTSTTSDQFSFTVINANGGWVGVPVFNVVITTTTDIAPFMPEWNIKVAPNPASVSFEVEIEGNILAPVTIEILDMQGKKIRQNKSVIPASNQKFDFSVSHLSAGVYVVRVIADKQIQTRKVFIKP